MPVAARLLADRDIGGTINGVKQSLSSWDGCMAHSYCKWPVIAAIIVASLIVVSLIWCLARCLCCGMECCCGCFSCCNACCPSPRGRNKNQGGYQPAPPTPYQYQQPAPMHPFAMHGGNSGGGFRNVPQTATFETPSRGKFNEDALPAMPSWSNASSRRIEQPPEEHEHEDVELEKLDHTTHNHNHDTHISQPEDALLASHAAPSREERIFASTSPTPQSGDNLHSQPYHDYDGHQQQVPPSPYASQRNVSGTAGGYHTGAATSPLSPGPYGAGQQNRNSYGNNHSAQPYPTGPSPSAYRSPMAGGYHTGGRQSPPQHSQPYSSYNSHAQNYPTSPYDDHNDSYEPSIAVPPSYHTYDVQSQSGRHDFVSPMLQMPSGPAPPPSSLTPGGRPMQGSWREV